MEWEGGWNGREGDDCGDGEHSCGDGEHCSGDKKACCYEWTGRTTVVFVKAYSTLSPSPLVFVPFSLALPSLGSVSN